MTVLRSPLRFQSRFIIVRLSPPAVHSTLRHVPSSRTFSASGPRHFSLVDIAVSGPTAVLDALHSSSLIPWYAALPATALLVRGVFVYYTSTIPSRKRAVVRQHLSPLVHASIRTAEEQHQRLKSTQTTRDGRQRLDLSTERSVFRYANAVMGRIKALHSIGKRFGAPVFHPLSFINFVTLISFMEAIRRKCGMKEGMLSLFLSPIQWIFNFGESNSSEAELSSAAAATTYTDTAPSSAATSDEILADLLEATLAAKKAALPQSSEVYHDGLDGQLSTESLSLPPAATDFSVSGHFDPTLQTEGFAWCIDLTLPDSTFILPSLLAMTMAANVLFRPSATQTTTVQRGEGPLAFLTLQQRIGLSASVFFLFVGAHMPAGMLLYWFPSILVGWLQGRWLEIRQPLPPSILPCRKQLRMRLPSRGNEA